MGALLRHRTADELKELKLTTAARVCGARGKFAARGPNGKRKGSTPKRRCRSSLQLQRELGKHVEKSHQTGVPHPPSPLCSLALCALACVCVWCRIVVKVPHTHRDPDRVERECVGGCRLFGWQEKLHDMLQRQANVSRLINRRQRR